MQLKAVSYLRQNEVAVISLHKCPEESNELLFSNLTGQKPEEEVTLKNKNNNSTQRGISAHSVEFYYK